MPSCVIFGCNTKVVNKRVDPPITLHLFPCNEKLRLKWIEAVGRENWYPGELNRLCSKHFKEDDFDRSPFYSKLMKGAVPSVFDVDQEYLWSKGYIYWTTKAKEREKKTNVPWTDIMANVRKRCSYYVDPLDSHTRSGLSKKTKTTENEAILFNSAFKPMPQCSRDYILKKYISQKYPDFPPIRSLMINIVIEQITKINACAMKTSEIRDMGSHKCEKSKSHSLSSLNEPIRYFIRNVDHSNDKNSRSLWCKSEKLVSSNLIQSINNVPKLSKTEVPLRLQVRKDLYGVMVGSSIQRTSAAPNQKNATILEQILLDIPERNVRVTPKQNTPTVSTPHASSLFNRSVPASGTSSTVVSSPRDFSTSNSSDNASVSVPRNKRPLGSPTRRKVARTSGAISAPTRRVSISSSSSDDAIQSISTVSPPSVSNARPKRVLVSLTRRKVARTSGAVSAPTRRVSISSGSSDDAIQSISTVSPPSVSTASPKRVLVSPTRRKVARTSGAVSAPTLTVSISPIPKTSAIHNVSTVPSVSAAGSERPLVASINQSAQTGGSITAPVQGVLPAKKIVSVVTSSSVGNESPPVRRATSPKMTSIDPDNSNVAQTTTRGSSTVSIEDDSSLPAKTTPTNPIIPVHASPTFEDSSCEALCKYVKTQPSRKMSVFVEKIVKNLKQNIGRPYNTLKSPLHSLDETLMKELASAVASDIRNENMKRMTEVVEYIDSTFSQFIQPCLSELATCDDIKASLWCTVCCSPATRYCCFIGRYCSAGCQEFDFKTHKEICGQTKILESTDSAFVRNPDFQALHKARLKFYPMLDKTGEHAESSVSQTPSVAGSSKKSPEVVINNPTSVASEKSQPTTVVNSNLVKVHPALVPIILKKLNQSISKKTFKNNRKHTAVPLKVLKSVLMKRTRGAGTPTTIDIEAPSSIDIEAPSSNVVQAPSSIDIEAPSSIDIEAPSSIDIEAPSSDLVEAPSSIDIEAPSSDLVEATSSIDIEAPSSIDIEAPSSNLVEAPSSIDIEAPSSIDIEAPSSIDIEAPSSIDIEAPSTNVVEGPPSNDVEAHSSNDVEAPSSNYTEATSSNDSGSPSSIDVEAPPSNDTEVTSSNDSGSPSSIDVEAPPSNDTEAPSSNDMEAYSSNDTEASSPNDMLAPLSNDMEAPPFNDIEAPSFNDMETPTFTDIEAPTFSDIEAPAFSDIETPSFNDMDAPSFNDIEALLPNNIDEELLHNNIDEALSPNTIEALSSNVTVESVALCANSGLRDEDFSSVSVLSNQSSDDPGPSTIVLPDSFPHSYPLIVVPPTSALLTSQPAEQSIFEAPNVTTLTAEITALQ